VPGGDCSAVGNRSPSPDAPVVAVVGYAAQLLAHYENMDSAFHTVAVVSQVVGHSSSLVENILVGGSVVQADKYWR